MKVRLLFLYVLWSKALMSCGGSGEESDVTEDVATTREGYPAGPYGLTENSKLANESFLGVDGEAFDLQSIYAQGGNRLLLLSTSAGWCTVCIEEQPKIQALYDQYKGKGLAVVVAIIEDANYLPAQATHAADWKSKYDLTFDVVADSDGALAAYYDPQLTPMNMIVDVSSMKILWLTTGWDQSTVEAILSSKL